MGHGSAVNQEDADDVSDLREARQLIAQLRRRIAHLEVMTAELGHTESLEGALYGFSLFLDEKHARLLLLLFEQGQLIDEQDQSWDFEQVFAEFVSGWLDVQWDLVQMEQERRSLHGITPSA